MVGPFFSPLWAWTTEVVTTNDERQYSLSAVLFGDTGGLPKSSTGRVTMRLNAPSLMTHGESPSVKCLL